MKKFVLTALTFILAASSTALAVEILEGKTGSNGKCSIRMELDQDLISFAGDGVAYGFLVDAKSFSESVKKGQRLITVTGSDGPVSARLTLNFSDKGVLESANYSQRTFVLSKRIKCTELE
ncbi:hypothetical protein AZI86_13975 [Bdellovibrio bacteriovorus]|uniref:Uncharacterized protein n=1 Tax=Bdellovibrio bacteriovorus TaxID=959 RepID=A0A150WJH5_BDEBC|nr:hypothetical protein [Bdellovibrio bacteriovorus]KYG63918.1 hypothetical protein AZI86_13975 [Bdellovibrio bacteriovorus]